MDGCYLLLNNNHIKREYNSSINNILSLIKL